MPLRCLSLPLSHNDPSLISDVRSWMPCEVPLPQLLLFLLIKTTCNPLLNSSMPGRVAVTLLLVLLFFSIFSSFWFAPLPSFSLSSPSHFFHELDGEVRLSLLSGTRMLPTFNVKGCRRRKTNKIIHILLPARLQARPLLLPLKSTNRGNKKG